LKIILLLLKKNYTFDLKGLKTIRTWSGAFKTIINIINIIIVIIIIIIIIIIINRFKKTIFLI
jgi:hypothetical protein